MKKWLIITGLATLSLTITACGRGRHHCQVCEPWQRDVVNEQYYHTYGMQIQPQEWSSRGQNGQVISTLRNGVMVTQSYRDGLLDGATTYTYPHSSSIQRTEIYDQGILVKSREHHSTGAPLHEKEHHSANSHTVNSWYENGAPKSRETYDDDRLIEADYYTMNNQVESRINDGAGVRVIRDEFGTLVQKDNFVNGVITISVTYYPNGTPKEEIPYKNGVVDGPKKIFNPSGDPYAVEGWTNNVKEGVTILYHNGEKSAEVPYFNGLKNGIEQRYRDGQYIVEEITWRHDRKHGPTYIYNGMNDVRVDWYYEGRLVTKNQFDRYTNPHR